MEVVARLAFLLSLLGGGVAVFFAILAAVCFLLLPPAAPVLRALVSRAGWQEAAFFAVVCLGLGFFEKIRIGRKRKER